MFLIIYGFACLFEITIFKYKIELQNILLVLMNLQKAAKKSQHRPYTFELDGKFSLFCVILLII